jgi:uncharacterized peroxidase-related enzyme
MSWIEIIEYEDADGALKKLYERIKGPENRIDNILKAHSLRPHTLEGHMALYKSVLHNRANTIPKWVLECIGVYVSHMNRCLYCVEHHMVGLRKQLKDDDRSVKIKKALERNEPESVFEGKQLMMMEYARLLTKQPYDVSSDSVQRLRDAGLSDGEILEVNQVASYFNYANRTVLGLGVKTEGDVLGLSPSEDGWAHK